MIADGAVDLSAFIAENLRLGSAQALPEIVLYQAGPASGLRRLASQSGLSPYWAYQWAGGTALGRYVLDRSNCVAGLRVLDLGTGSGLVAIAAAKAGAREVVGVDIDAAAITATALNAAANAVRVSGSVADILGGPPPSADLVLVGDLFYARALAGRVTVFLTCCREAGIAVLVGDPGRAHLPLARLRRLAEVAVPDFGDGGRVGSASSAVYAFG